MTIPVSFTESRIAGGSPVYLLRLLCEQLQEWAVQYVRDSGRGLRNPVRVHCQVMPKPRGHEDQFDVPFLLVYLMDGQDYHEQARVTVGILAGTYSEQDEGVLDALHLAMAVRRWLLSRQYIDRFRLLPMDDESRLKWSTFDQVKNEDRTHPFYYVHLQAAFQAPTILPEMEV